MGTCEPPLTMEDFAGMRVRALGGTGEALKNLGAVPTSVPAPEVYNGIERGIFRAAAFPYTYTFASYKIDEIANWHTTNLAPGATNCPTIVRIPAYEALPDQYKDLLAKPEPHPHQALPHPSPTADTKTRPARD